MKTALERETDEKLTLEVSGLAAFSKLELAATRFRKQVLRVGRWVHPTTGEVIDITPTKLAQIVANTQRWLELGHKVWFPATHSDDPRDNLGWCLSIDREGDEAFAVIEVLDDATAAKVGSTITDVSPGIWWNARASDGVETFPDGVIEHIAATPCPVMPGQPNFVRLAREVKEPTVKRDPNAAPAADKTAPGAPAPAAPADKAQLSLNFIDFDLTSALKGLLDLSADASETAIFEAVKALAEDEEEEVAAGEQETDMSRKANDEKITTDLAKIEATLDARYSDRVKSLEGELEATRVKSANERVELAYKRSVELGLPIDKDTRDQAVSLLSRKDEASQKIGAKMLELAIAPAEVTSRARQSGALLPPADAQAVADAKKTKLARDRILAKAYASQGVEFEQDAEGFIVRTGPKK